MNVMNVRMFVVRSYILEDIREYIYSRNFINVMDVRKFLVRSYVLENIKEFYS